MKPPDHDLTPDRHLTASLRDLLVGRVCIVGVGNRQRGDDGAGPRVIDARRPGTWGVWLDAGIAPENYLEPIAMTNPDTVLIVDAVAFGGFPGERCLMDATAMDTLVLSTHAGCLGMLSDYLSARTGARVRVLAIQPETIDAHEGLSQPVAKSVLELTATLSDLLGNSASLGCRRTVSSSLSARPPHQFRDYAEILAIVAKNHALPPFLHSSEAMLEARNRVGFEWDISRYAISNGDERTRKSGQIPEKSAH